MRSIQLITSALALALLVGAPAAMADEVVKDECPQPAVKGTNCFPLGRLGRDFGGYTLWFKGEHAEALQGAWEAGKADYDAKTEEARKALEAVQARLNAEWEAAKKTYADAVAPDVAARVKALREKRDELHK